LLNRRCRKRLADESEIFNSDNDHPSPEEVLPESSTDSNNSDFVRELQQKDKELEELRTRLESAE